MMPVALQPNTFLDRISTNEIEMLSSRWPRTVVVAVAS
jgi:hypothetical protein